MVRVLPISSVGAFGILLTVACGSAEPTARPSRTPDTADATVGPKDGSDDGGEADTAAAEGGEGSDGSVDAGGFEETDGEGGDTLEDVLAQCGDVDFDNPTAEVLNLSLTGLPIIKTGSQVVLGFPIDYEVKIQPALAIKSTLEQSVTTTQLTVAEAKPALARGAAEKQAAQQAGVTTTTFLPVDGRSGLAAEVEAWSGVVCTAQPGTKVTSNIGGKNVVTSFNPPLPASVSPKADPARYAAELAKARTFTNIVATVEKSDDPAVPAGQTYTGTVTVSPIAPTFETTLSNGQKATIGADLAYEVKIDFGSVAITNSLGLKPSTKFYIDTTNHVYKVVVADIGDPTTPAAIFLK